MQTGKDATLSGWLRQWWPVLALILFALILRAPAYGDSDLFLDEDYYLLVGDRMLHGALPYVDLWDRKPVGLFFIYAAIRAVGGEGVMQYQVAASLCAGATGAMIWYMARRATGMVGALAAGALYIAWLGIFSGGGGQSPVFYNLLTAIAACLAFRANDAADGRTIGRLGNQAMLLWGLILQIKYTAVPEGIFFGLWFLWRLRESGAAHGGLAMAAFRFMALALAPTIMVTIFYLVIGHLDAFIYANFLSIFSRGDIGAEMVGRAREFFLYALPSLLLVAIFGLLLRWRLAGQRRDTIMLALWMLAALAGFLMLGGLFDHYFIPCLLPLFLLAAPLFAYGRIGQAMALLLLAQALIGAKFPDFALHRKKRVAVERLTDAIRPYVQGHCLYIYDGPSSLYRTTGACIPTRYAYPDHLSNLFERNSVGIDTRAEVIRLLATRPGAIVNADLGVLPGMDPRTATPLGQALARDYVCVAAVPSIGRTFYVHALRPLVAPQGRTLSCPSSYLPH